MLYIAYPSFAHKNTQEPDDTLAAELQAEDVVIIVPEAQAEQVEQAEEVALGYVEPLETRYAFATAHGFDVATQPPVLDTPGFQLLFSLPCRTPSI
jgi:hypothetical protein